MLINVKTSRSYFVVRPTQKCLVISLYNGKFVVKTSLWDKSELWWTIGSLSFKFCPTHWIKKIASWRVSESVHSAPVPSRFFSELSWVGQLKDVIHFLVNKFTWLFVILKFCIYILLLYIKKGYKLYTLACYMHKLLSDIPHLADSLFIDMS